MRKPNNDLNLIVNLISKKTQNESIKVDKKLSTNSWINITIDYLKAHEGMCTLDELLRDFRDLENFIKSHNEFFEVLNKSNKIIFDGYKNTFQLKTKYNLKNIEELKEKIRSSEFGLPEDDELLDTYHGIKSDLERLKRENFMKVIYNDEKKFNVLFYRDCEDKIEKIIINPEYDLALKELRKIWKDEINYFTDDTVQYNKRSRRDNEVVGKKRKRKAKLIANNHLPADFGAVGNK
jgi:hypothetical protein